MANRQSDPDTPFVTSDWASVANVHRFAHQAMATTFEIIVQYEERLYAQQAAEAAFDELDRIEGELSRYIENSDVARLNNLPANQPLQLGLDTYACLDISKQMHARTNGVFDVTIGFLLDCWRDEDKRPRVPAADELAFARRHTGMDLLVLDEATTMVALRAGPVRVDLGGVGKGYGVDRMAELLREWSVDRALIHGGFSSVLALDAPEGARGWPVTLSHPQDRRRVLARLELERMAVSGSGLEKGGHIIDPRLGRPVEGKIAAWSVTPNAGVGDAFSTAFMIMAPAEIEALCAQDSAVRALVIVRDEDADASRERVLPIGAWTKTELLGYD